VRLEEFRWLVKKWRVKPKQEKRKERRVEERKKKSERKIREKKGGLNWDLSANLTHSTARKNERGKRRTERFMVRKNRDRGRFVD